MKQFEHIQKEIQEMNSGIEMTGFLIGIEAAAIVWCKKNAPDNIYIDESGGIDLMINGLSEYLDSEVETKG